MFPALVFASCYASFYVYSPAAHNVPVLTAKNDSKLGVNYSADITQKSKGSTKSHNSKGSGIDVQGACDISKNIAVQGTYHKRSEMNEGRSFLTSIDDAVMLVYRRSSVVGGRWSVVSGRWSAFFS